jgi:methanogenic corrinoid protein MtbC1
VHELFKAIVKGDEKRAVALVKMELDMGTDPQYIVQSHMIPAMDEVGRKFEVNEAFVPELLIAGRAMKGALEIIQPILKSTGSEPLGKVVIGTVQGDLHDIGKNLVAAMLEGAGYEIIDLGVDVGVTDFYNAVIAVEPDIVAMSTLLTTTTDTMKEVIKVLEERDLREHVKVLIGGAPITQSFCVEIGADGYSDNAAGAVRKAKGL